MTMYFYITLVFFCTRLEYIFLFPNFDGAFKGMKLIGIKTKQMNAYN